jgi:hypothetical protein
LQAAPDLPVNVFPRDALLLHELNEPIDIPVPISHVLSYHYSVEVNEDLRLGTDHPLSLVQCEQGTAIDAAVELGVRGLRALLAVLLILRIGVVLLYQFF